LTAGDQPAGRPLDLADALQAAVPQVGTKGEALTAFLNRLDGRAHGVLALILGVLLLIPVKWMLPQLAGLLLLASGWRLFGGAATPLLPFVGRRVIARARLAALAVLVSRQTWLRAVSPPRLTDFAAGFALKAAAVALIVAGLAALAPCTHYLLGLSLAVLGVGLMQRDGAATLAGMALSFAAGAFTLTLVAGAAAGAPFASAWGQENLPFLHSPAKALLPDDHAAAR
jgi:hypothetical protein